MNEERLKKKLPSEQLSFSARAYLKFSLEEKELFLLMFSKNNFEIKKLIDGISSQFLDIVKEKFKDGRRMRVSEKGASITAWAMVHGLAKLVSNNNLELISGSLLEVSVKFNLRNSLGIPDTSVMMEGEKAYVYKVSKDNVVNKTEIKVGLRSEGSIEVISGLNIGDVIVAEGLKKVYPRSKIKPIKN